MKSRIWRFLLFWVGVGLWAPGAWAQVCAAPGRDAPGTISGIVNTYYEGNGNLAVSATALTLGTATGAVGTVTAGDLLLVLQMQGADIDSSNDERYGDGTGAAGATPTTSLGQANGHLVNANYLAGQFEYVRVVSAIGSAVTFSPALTNAYQQNIAVQPRHTYQVIRVPQLPSASIGGTAVIAGIWNGLVGGVVAIDVTGALTFSGAGPHIDASNRGFRGGSQGVANSPCCNTIPSLVRSTLTSDGGSKGEGLAGTPRYVNTSAAGTFNGGTRFSDAAPTSLDNGAAHVGYPNGDFMRGAPGNAGGGGNTHNAAGGGGGNGGQGGIGGQTYNGDSLRDLGGFGGSQSPQSGVLAATRLFMGGGGGSGSLNDGSAARGSGGNGGGIVLVRAGSLVGAGLMRADGQRGWDSNVSNDAGGGGGAGGSVMVIASSGHGNVAVQARGGDGADSNVTTGSLAFAPPAGSGGACCNGEREGPGGGGGGGAVVANATLGTLSLAGGINGLSREDKRAGFSGNMRASPGFPGISNMALAASAVVGVREGYLCKPVLTVEKDTQSATRSVPPDTTGTYRIAVRNASTAGWAYGIGVQDALPTPFTLVGNGTATLTYSGSATYNITQPATTLAVALSPATWGQAGEFPRAFNLAPGAAVTLTFNIALNTATAGTYQNGAVVRYTDPTRSTGVAAGSATANPTASPGGAYADGSAAGGSNYVSSSSNRDDVVVSGVAGNTADFAISKSGSTSAFVGDPVSYTLLVSNAGPADSTGGLVITDNVPASIGTVTWVCTLTSAGGSGDCDTITGGPGVTGTGNSIVLSNARLSSGGQLSIVVAGVAAAAVLMTNTATVALPAGYNDPNLANNQSTATATFTTPTADLNISKTNGTTTVALGGVVVYTIAVGNAGPAPVSNAVVTDPAAAGLAKLSVSCTAFGGAVCPAGLGTSTFESPGLVIPTLPVGGSVVFLLSASVSGSPTVSNSVFVTSTLGDPSALNNTATDTDTAVANPTQVVSAAQICPVGTTEQAANLLSNSDFSNLTALIGSSQTEQANNTVAPDTSVATQSGFKSYDTGAVQQRPFPGDAGRSVGNANNWLYSNGNNTGLAWRLLRRTVSGLVANRTYQFLYYGSNAVVPGGVGPDLPIIQTRVVAGTTSFALGTTTFGLEATTDTWTISQSVFAATATTVTLELWDLQLNANRDALATTQLLLRECKPSADPSVTKSDGTATVGVFGVTSYSIVVANNNPLALGAADGIAVRDPYVPSLVKSSVACAAAGGATCPASSTVSGIESAGGLAIAALPFGGTLTFTVGATNSQVSGSVTNTVALILPPGMTDANLANNSAEEVNSVIASANISITKTNNVSTLVAGSTTSYTIVVGNSGPSPATGAVLSDPAAAGLVCTAAACSATTGGASCTGLNMANLVTGFALPAFPANSSITVTVECGVVATGL